MQQCNSATCVSSVALPSGIAALCNSISARGLRRGGVLQVDVRAEEGCCTGDGLAKGIARAPSAGWFGGGPTVQRSGRFDARYQGTTRAVCPRPEVSTRGQFAVLYICYLFKIAGRLQGTVLSHVRKST